MNDFNNIGYDYRHSFEHNRNKLKIIDSMVTHDSLKNSLVKNIAGRYLLTCSDSEEQKKMLDVFLNINTNKSHLNYISDLSDASMNLSKGKKIPNLLLQTTDNTVKDLHSIIHRPSVIYFWSSSSQGHYKKVHARAEELNSLYPKYQFIGINTDEEPNEWMNIVTKYSYNKVWEFQFDDLKEAEKKLVIYSVNKAIIVNRDGTIKEGSTNLFSSNIEKILSGSKN